MGIAEILIVCLSSPLRYLCLHVGCYNNFLGFFNKVSHGIWCFSTWIFTITLFIQEECFFSGAQRQHKYDDVVSFPSLRNYFFMRMINEIPKLLDVGLIQFLIRKHWDFPVINCCYFIINRLSMNISIFSFIIWCE